MTDDLFQLVFKGEIKEGQSPDTVSSAVGRLLNCNEKQLRRLFSGQQVILKDRLDYKSAERFKNIFNQTGATCHVNRIVPVMDSSRESNDQVATVPQVEEMSCPKCGKVQRTSTSCMSCGIFIEKYLQRQAEMLSTLETGINENEERLSKQDAADEVRPVVGFRENLFVSARSLILPEATPGNPVILGIKALLLLALLVWSGRFVFVSISSNFAGESLLHLINLPFHEAGHIFFRPLGRFMTSAGGSITQIMVPLICMGVLLIQTRDAFGAGICLWWAGQNFLDLAPYINDARAGVMPLIGGNTGRTSPYGFHDWEFLLTETGLLRFDHLLARIAHVSGSLIMLLGLVWAGLILFRQFRAGQNINMESVA